MLALEESCPGTSSSEFFQEFTIRVRDFSCFIEDYVLYILNTISVLCF